MVVPQARQAPVALAPPKPTLATIPQRSIVQTPVAQIRPPVQVPVAPVQVRPIQANAVPYSNRTLNTTSYRPSLQLQANPTVFNPYKQVTYRPNNINTKMVNRPVPVMKLPAPVRTVAPVMPNVSSYRTTSKVTLPPAAISRPNSIVQTPIVKQIQTIPAQTAVVSPVTPKLQIPVQPTVRPVPVPVRPTPVVSTVPAQVPVRPAPVVQTVRPVPVPVRPAPVVQTVRPVPVPVRPAPVVQTVRPVQVPVRPAPVVQTVRPVPVPVRPAPVVSTVPVARPPVAVVTPVSVAPNVVRAPVQPVVAPVAQPMVQNKAFKPATYTASTYRPTSRRNMGGAIYRPAPPIVNNAFNPTGYTTRTYRPRRL